MPKEPITFYLIVLRTDKVHSIHTDKGRALGWKECKSHDGEDPKIVELSEDDADDLIEMLGAARFERESRKA